MNVTLNFEWNYVDQESRVNKTDFYNIIWVQRNLYNILDCINSFKRICSKRGWGQNWTFVEERKTSLNWETLWNWHLKLGQLKKLLCIIPSNQTFEKFAAEAEIYNFPAFSLRIIGDFTLFFHYFLLFLFFA